MPGTLHLQGICQLKMERSYNTLLLLFFFCCVSCSLKLRSSQRTFGIKSIKVLLYNLHFVNLLVVVWRTWCFKISMRVSATFTSQLLHNYTTNMTKFSIEIKFGMAKFFKPSHNVADVKNLSDLSDRNSGVTQSISISKLRFWWFHKWCFVYQKVSCPLTIRMHCNWPL